jgi:hypothetical protein
MNELLEARAKRAASPSREPKRQKEGEAVKKKTRGK